ncbi:cell division protein SepF [Longirhabdus pacifica]|uniref:cell division protein SepF n=1 Tax=Longirhabdus pacifica TaxID=2305227 RepID=UPI001008F4BF|nr:cell division protein SepF [Longirhabdus pacifica]
MGVMNKVMNFLGLQEEEEVVKQEKIVDMEDEHASELPPQFNKNVKNNVVSIHAKNNVKVQLCEPRSYDETQHIADHLRNRNPVVVNLQRVRREQAIRIVDFLSGTVYALNGTISKIGNDIFMCTPDNVPIEGAISELLGDNQE